MSTDHTHFVFFFSLPLFWIKSESLDTSSRQIASHYFCPVRMFNLTHHHAWVWKNEIRGLADLAVEIFSVSGKVYLHLAPRPAPRCKRSAMMAVCYQRSKGLETSKKLSRVGELSQAERLQGSQGYPGARVTLALS